MQSSPVAIRDFKIEIPIDRPMCIPSVLGLSSGAIMLTPWNVRLLHPRMLTWKFLLSSDVIPLTIELVMKSNLKLCSFDMRSISRVRDGGESHAQTIREG